MPLFAGERMTVSVCTRGHLDKRVELGAEAAAASLFHSMNIEIVWAKCEAGLEGDDAVQQHWFTLRLRDGRPFIKPAPAALDTLGEAFLPVDNGGYIVEVYYQAVQAVATAKGAELTRLLGCVIAHELGHLLLGPGHAAEGVMRPAWDRRDLEAIRQGCLRFSPVEAASMRRVLQGTVQAPATAP
ncbi:MAG: hypothetical protein WCB12_06010 [Bryobacteraceae bacterium]